MPGTGISKEVQQFIFQHIDSIEQLEVLLLLRNRPGQSWSAHQVNNELRTNLSSVTNRLVNLHTLGLLCAHQDDQPVTYYYDPKSFEIDKLIADLDETHRIRPHRVYELIFSSLKRARKFADAFTVGEHN